MATTTADTSFWPTPGTVPSWGIPVPAANAGNVVVAGDPGAGNRRGVIIFSHPSQPPQTIPLTVPNGTGVNVGDFATKAAAIGWVTMYPAQPVDYSVQGVNYYQSMSNMVANDPGHGSTLVKVYSRYLAKNIAYARSHFKLPNNPPIIAAGFSLGAWVSAILAANNQSSLAGYICHCLPTVWANIASTQLGYPNATGAAAFAGFLNTNNSGIDLGASYLSGVTIPGVIGLGMNDGTVGWGVPGAGTCKSSPASTTVSSITNSSGSATFTAASVTGLQLGQTVSGVGLSGFFVGQFWCLWTITNISGSVVTITGQGTPSMSNGTYSFTYGNPQSNADQIISSAGNCTRYTAAGTSSQPYQVGHLLLAADNDFYTGTWMPANNFTNNSFYPAFF